MKEGDISTAFESRDNEGREGNVITRLSVLRRLYPLMQPVSKTTISFNMANNQQMLRAIENFIKENRDSIHTLAPCSGLRFQTKAD